MMSTGTIRRSLVMGAALYGLCLAALALRNQIVLAPRAAAGDPEAQSSVTQRPEATLLGIPNAAFGVAYYLLLLGVAGSGRLHARPWRQVVRLAVLAAMIRSLTLIADLIRLREWCPVCIRANVTNIALALIVLPDGSDG